MHRLILFSLALTLVLVGAAQSAIVVDQQQLSADPTPMAWFSQTNLAQSFQQANSNIAGAAIQLVSVFGDTDDVTISLWTALPNASGTMMATGTAVGVTGGSWAQVSWTPVSITPNTTYYLVFTSAHDALGIAGSASNPYPRGYVYANPGYGSFPNFDYTFRTYADVGEGVPEPASVLLVMGGLAAAFLVRRRLA